MALTVRNCACFLGWGCLRHEAKLTAPPPPSPAPITLLPPPCHHPAPLPCRGYWGVVGGWWIGPTDHATPEPVHSSHSTTKGHTPGGFLSLCVRQELLGWHTHHPRTSGTPTPLLRASRDVDPLTHPNPSLHRRFVIVGGTALQSGDTTVVIVLYCLGSADGSMYLYRARRHVRALGQWCPERPGK